MNGKRDEEFERQLVRRLAAGEPEAVEDLVQRYADDVYRFVFNRVGGSAQDAEDVVQETFIAALDAIDNFKGDSKLSTWLFSIASHKAIDHQRWFARRPEVDLQDKTFFLSGDDPLPSQAFARFEVRQAVRKTLLQLPSHYRTALVLKYVEEMTVTEMTKVMKRSEKSIESILVRARRLLARMFEGRYGEE